MRMSDLRRHFHWDDLNPAIYAAGAAALAVIILSFGIARFGAPPKSKRAMTLSVRWGREKLRVPLPSPGTKLGALRAILAEQTGLPPTSFKLVHAGAVMKDDNAPLSTYGLRSGSKIAIIDGAANAHTGSVAEKKNKTKPETEEATVAVIRNELERAQQHLEPALDVFLLTIAPPQPQQPSQTSSAPEATPVQNPPSSTESEEAAPQPASTSAIPKPPPSSALPDIEMEHNRLGEELLQTLLRLDILAMDRSWESARAERKGAVKRIQALLDRLDGGWRERNKRLASQKHQKIQ